ncbi:long-chain-fatty-acid--CoA ligase [Candidatus Termititenax dinenymphae]|uniref:Long-chain-fatty-acid--CoA ligase n=1 Tax=Candidatus Termititenax dinenymphae TaxID=2218523 RepID=A0A388TJP3_9BACT|nr:long-chain-fatty-acid--CoA ligase [Candidatus Termititenax dinenymphae]
MTELRNLYDVYAKKADEKEKHCLFEGKYSYRQVWNMVKNRALFLKKQGIKTGDSVAILSGNGWEWCATHMAITVLGAVALHLDPNLNAAMWQIMLDRVQPKALFISNDFANENLRCAKTLDIHADWNDKDAVLPPPSVTFDDIAALIFTSGTTGDPKIVQLTHGNLYFTSKGLIDGWMAKGIIDGTENFLAILPLHHSYGLIANFVGPIVLGSTIFFQPSLKGPDIMKSLAANPIHVFCGVPQLWELFFDGIVSKVKAQSKITYCLFMSVLNTAGVWRKIPGLRKILAKVFEPVHQVIGKEMKVFISGGASLKPTYFKYYTNMGFTIIEGYGLTETTGPALLSVPGQSQRGSVGGPIEGNEVVLRNANADKIGEVWMRGVSVMPGYYNNPAANAQVFDKDGWFNTGDLGFIDELGELHITGRFKNLIILDSGKNVYPEELEAYYQDSPLIEEISVFGYKIKGIETVYAAIVPREKSKDSYQQIKNELDRMNKGLPSYKTIAAFAISFTPLPRNSTKKLVVREIIKELEQGKYQRESGKGPALRPQYKPEAARQKEVLKVLADKLNRKTFYQDQSLLDLEIDSLRLLDLAAHLELNLNIAIDLDKFSNLQNFKEIVEYVAACDEAQRPTDNLLAGEITRKLKPNRNRWVDFLVGLAAAISRKKWSLEVQNAEFYYEDNCIYAANHQSYLDIMWLLATLPKSLREKTYMLGKKELAFLPWLFGRLPIIFVERQGQALSSLKAGADILRQGGSLIVFPEGTRTLDGNLGEFKIGAALLAHKLGKKIVPITVKGAYEIYPRQRRLPNWKSKQKGELVLHPAIDPQKFKTAEELNQKIKDVIAGG